jgi:hypothetical protein
MSLVTTSHFERIPLPPLQAGKTRTVLAILAAVTVVLCVAGAINDTERFLASYLVAMLFALSLALGALFWVMLHHLTGAGWSVVVRRVPEQLSRTLPWLALLFIPVVLGMRSLYSWSDVGHPPDAILQAKHNYLNIPFFLVRSVLYFGVWVWLALRLSTWSARQDIDKDLAYTQKMRRISAPGMVLLGVTTTFASFDWIMSLDPHWYSTIFGVYFWAGSIVGSLATLIILVVLLRSLGTLASVVSAEHLHDLGKLLFSFVIFWAYIAFSQYFLIWYANIPEETAWYVRRLEGGWLGVALALVLGHFALPFVVLLARSAKRNGLVLGFVALGVLGFHYVDLYWQIMPQLLSHGPAIHWLDGTTLVAVLASCGLVVLHGMRRDALIPVGDPQLLDSLNLHSE